MAPKLTVATRKRIKKMLDENFKPKIIAEKIGCTINQVNNVKYQKVKLNNQPRVDKGKYRSKKMESQTNGENEVDINNIEDFLESQLKTAAEDLSARKMAPDERIKITESITRILKNLDVRRLNTHIKRPDAELIIRIMRRFSPELSDKEIITVYYEEFEKLQRDLK